MSARLAYRIATLLLVLFVVAHIVAAYLLGAS